MPLATQIAGIGDDSITFAKMQNIDTSRVLGRGTALAGDPEQLTLSSDYGLTFTYTAASLKINTPQDLQTAASPTFDTATLTGRVGIGISPSYPLHISYASVKDVTNYIINMTTTLASVSLAGSTRIYGSKAYVGATDIVKGAYSFEMAAYNAEAYIYGSTVCGTIYGVYSLVRDGGTAGAAQTYGVYSRVNLAGTGTKTLVEGVYAGITATAAVTIPSAYCVYTLISINGSTVSDARGFMAEMQQASGTATLGYILYGFYTGTWGTKWGIYLSGEAQNYLSGSLWIGGTSSSSTLFVANTMADTGSCYNTNLSAIWSSKTATAMVVQQMINSAYSANDSSRSSFSWYHYHARLATTISGTSNPNDVYGINWVLTWSGTATIGNAYSIYSYINSSSSGAGTNVANYYANMNFTGAQTLDSVYQNFGIMTLDNASLAITTLSGFYYTFTATNVSSITTFYGIYMNYTGTKATYLWGLYLNGFDRNFLDGNLQIGSTGTLGTNSDHNLAMYAGTAPSAISADMPQMWVEDIGAAAGKAAFHIMDESGADKLVVVGVQIKGDTGDPANVHEGKMTINTFDNTLKYYADGAWRSLATW